MPIVVVDFDIIMRSCMWSGWPRRCEGRELTQRRQRLKLSTQLALRQPLQKVSLPSNLMCMLLYSLKVPAGAVFAQSDSKTLSIVLQKSFACILTLLKALCKHGGLSGGADVRLCTVCSYCVLAAASTAMQIKSNRRAAYAKQLDWDLFYIFVVCAGHGSGIKDLAAQLGVTLLTSQCCQSLHGMLCRA